MQLNHSVISSHLLYLIISISHVSLYLKEIVFYISTILHLTTINILHDITNHFLFHRKILRYSSHIK